MKNLFGVDLLKVSQKIQDFQDPHHPNQTVMGSQIKDLYSILFVHSESQSF
jgi:hypothetical protein